jgi:hypothetical protein
MEKNGKTLIITGAGAQPMSLFKRSGFTDRLGADSLFAHRAAGVARAREIAGH